MVDKHPSVLLEGVLREVKPWLWSFDIDSPPRICDHEMIDHITFLPSLSALALSKNAFGLLYFGVTVLTKNLLHDWFLEAQRLLGKFLKFSLPPHHNFRKGSSNQSWLLSGTTVERWTMSLQGSTLPLWNRSSRLRFSDKRLGDSSIIAVILWVQAIFGFGPLPQSWNQITSHYFLLVGSPVKISSDFHSHSRSCFVHFSETSMQIACGVSAKCFRRKQIVPSLS